LRLWEEEGGPARGTADSYRMELPALSDAAGRTTVSTWALCCLRTLDAGDGMPVRRIATGPAGEEALQFNAVVGTPGSPKPAAKL